MAIRKALYCAFILALVGCRLPADGGEPAAAPQGCVAGEARGVSEAGLAQLGLCVSSSGKTHGFTVELAETPQQQTKGMMFRTSLADDAGMLFPYSSPQILSFWMKNTVIPLDIIFIRADGTIESIAANAVPYSLESVSSGEPVIAVLELRGGLAAELGIKAGDRISWSR